jgi:outer membrane lipoprotein SlyB
MNRKISVAAAITAVMLSGCAGVPLSSTRFSGASNLAVQTVQDGTVIRTMPIKINNSARVDQATGLGAGAGGIAGGIGGAMMGSPLIGALVGAVGGGVIGDAITPGSGVGTDVFVKLSSGQTLSIPEAGVVHLTPGERVYVMRSGKGHYRVEPANQPAAVSPANPAVTAKLSRLAATPAPAPAPAAPQRAKP